VIWIELSMRHISIRDLGSGRTCQVVRDEIFVAMGTPFVCQKIIRHKLYSQYTGLFLFLHAPKDGFCLPLQKGCNYQDFR
jgi:hypothetical protein